jgi:hypothetical protein
MAWGWVGDNPACPFAIGNHVSFGRDLGPHAAWGLAASGRADCAVRCAALCYAMLCGAVLCCAVRCYAVLYIFHPSVGVHGESVAGLVVGVGTKGTGRRGTGRGKGEGGQKGRKEWTRPRAFPGEDDPTVTEWRQGSVGMVGG